MYINKSVNKYLHKNKKQKQKKCFITLKAFLICIYYIIKKICFNKYIHKYLKKYICLYLFMVFDVFLLIGGVFLDEKKLIFKLGDLCVSNYFFDVKVRGLYDLIKLFV